LVRARKAGEAIDPMKVPTTTMENTMKRKRLSLDMSSLMRMMSADRLVVSSLA
jgi:hypothetical protein